MKALIPENEHQRLAALHHYAPLPAIPNSLFDRLTRLAAHLFSAPVAMVTLLEADRSLIKSSYGIEASEISREQSFCAHTILCRDVLLVGDATQDIRFADFPVVAGPPYARFYAGAPLLTAEDLPLGTLCVVDGSPRLEPDPAHLAGLKDLAAEVVELLELYRSKSEIAAMQAQLMAQRAELEQSQELWRKTEQRATLALEAGKMGYWERDAKTDLVTLSANICAIIGLERRDHQFTMDQWLQSIYDDDRPRVLEILERAARTQENYLLAYRTRGVDGIERWLTSSGTYRKDSEGNFIGAQGVSWDSTASEETARRLMVSEELFRGLSESVPVGVFCADLEGRMTYANPRTAAICGRPAEQLLDRRWFENVHPGDQARMMQVIADCGAALTSSDDEYRLLLPDGTIRWVQSRTSIMFDQSGRATGKIGTLDDITQRRQTMQELEQAKEAAEVANRAKDMFLANVSHELRTPLNGVLGMTDLLLDTVLSREQLEMAETVRESGRSLLTLVNDMLDVGRIEAGKIKIERLPFNLPIIIRQTVLLIEPEAKKKNLKIRLDYEPDLPASYFGDPHRIEQILLNYLSNAVKFSSSGEIVIDVGTDPHVQDSDVQPVDNPSPKGADARGQMREELATRRIVLSVTDNGLGINPEAQSKLFQPFSQVDGSSTRRSGGVGLGLAICKRLAELMGGSVGLISAPGQGSTFWLRLPLPLNVDSGGTTATARPMASRASGRLLLAEDNPVNQKVAMGALRKLGWEADIAPNGLIALDLFCRNEYALVFMDCHMPEMDGFAATQQIRQWERSHGRETIPIVALTAHAISGDRERCLAAGMNDYLTKPFGLDQLRDILDRWSRVPV